MSFFAIAFGPMRVVADPDQPVTAVAGVDQAVGTSSQNSLALFDLALATGLLVVNVAVLLVRQRPVFAFAVARVVPEGQEPLERRPLADGGIFSRSGVCSSDTVIGGVVAAVVLVFVVVAAVLVIVVLV